ncbi:MAG: ATP-dependent RNA helicase SUPV3L1/SUV3 [Brevundimonas sp.]|jgi:ATP-dependent RNA helicase SUPV3L1/SUV3|uniref:helicase-related protein n=1 Tax=Brevundimonas sp. TaxID=1871086 RepID=UPI0039E6A256
MNDRPTGLAPSRVTAVLGPTNTGKTHLAVERMLGHASGMIGLPLRLLAREIYDRIVARMGARSVALVTGEEKIIPPRPHWWVCTVEAMPLEKTVEFLAVDEIQLCADPERGHLFTQRLLHARGQLETMFLGAGTMAPLVRRLVPDAEIVSRDRLSTLSYAGSKKLTRLPPRSAIVAFSADQVYAIAELIRRQRGGAAVVMGALSPRTRNAQVALFQSGEVDFLVATDAIGMGLNMDVDHVAFAGLRKFDGRRTRWLHAHEIGQIAGRAGRHLRDGTFGVTGECDEIDADIVEQVVEHHFDPVLSAEWRNARLDYDTLPDLLRSLTVTPGRDGLTLSGESLDETVLRRLMQDEAVARVAGSRGAVMRLWEACQLPDFQKTTLDEHSRLALTVFKALTGRGGRLTEDWFAARFDQADRDDGQIDQLSARLAAVRTLTYIANRPDWLHNPKHWRERAKVLEERLSDVLHERLTARFVDRRTTALMRALNVREDMATEIEGDGQVIVEGQAVGRLTGVAFTPERGATGLEDRALRAAARHAVGPEIARRLGRLAADEDAAFSVLPDGAVLWRGEIAARVTGGDPFNPRVSLLGDLGPAPSRERAVRRVEAWLAAEAGRALRPLKRLRDLTAGGSLKGLPRGLAFRLIEAGGLIDRRAVQADLAALSQAERRALKTMAVRVGVHSVWMPALMKPRAVGLMQAHVADQAFRPAPGTLIATPEPLPGPRALSAFGLRAVGPWLVPVEALERMAELVRAEKPEKGRPALSEAALAELGWSADQGRAILNALKRAPDRKPAKTGPVKDSPFAALAVLNAPAPATARRRRRRKSASRPE